MLVMYFSIGLTLLMVVPGLAAVGERCLSSEMCDMDECCVSHNQPRGRRTVLSQITGSCQKNGTTGSLCYMKELETNSPGLHYDCPCAVGYTCNPSGMSEVPKGESGTCELETAPLATKPVLSVVQSASRTCNSGADCTDTECCVTEDRPIGKRAAATGHCSSMGDIGTGCLADMKPEKPTGVVYACPCLTNLTCHGSGIIDVPLGETGTCV